MLSLENRVILVEGLIIQRDKSEFKFLVSVNWNYNSKPIAILDS